MRFSSTGENGRKPSLICKKGKYKCKCTGKHFLYMLCYADVSTLFLVIFRWSVHLTGFPFLDNLPVINNFSASDRLQIPNDFWISGERLMAIWLNVILLFLSEIIKLISLLFFYALTSAKSYYKSCKMFINTIKYKCFFVIKFWSNDLAYAFSCPFSLKMVPLMLYKNMST